MTSINYYDSEGSEITANKHKEKIADVANFSSFLDFSNKHHGVGLVERSLKVGHLPILDYSHWDASHNSLVGELDSFTGPVWNDLDDDRAGHYFTGLASAVRNIDADGLLLSGGIDSLILFFLTENHVPCFTWDVERGQTEFARKLCHTFGKRHVIIPYHSKKIDSVMEKAFQLRSNHLGHYLPWNSGLVGSGDFAGMKFISGQNADSLLMIDTFAPVFTAVGTRRAVHLNLSKKYRRTINEHWLCGRKSTYDLAHFQRKIFNATLRSNEEHVKLSISDVSHMESHSQIPPDLQATLNSLVGNTVIKEYGDFTRNLKKFKYFRFIAPMLRTYEEQRIYFGIERSLPYSDTFSLKQLLNYTPSNENVLRPKNLFYEFLNKNRFDFDLEKQKTIKHFVGIKYLFGRIASRRQYTYSAEALNQLKKEASYLKVGLTDIQKALGIKDSHLGKKNSLMRLDRALNYMSYTGFRL